MLRLPVLLEDRRREQVRPPDDLVERTEAHRAEDLANLLGDEEEVVDHLLGRAGELGAEDRVLGGDADRAGVQVALAHHQAAHRDQRGGGEAVFLGAQAGGDDDVAAGLELAVGLEPDPAAQAVADQGLLRLGQADLPGNARVADARERRGAGAAAVAADQDPVGVALGDPRRDRPHAGGGHELDRDLGVRVGVLQVEDELGEVLDAVDVVMRRRRNQPDARRAVAGLGDEAVDLVAGELPPFARLGSLRHLDLDLDRVGQVVRRDAEPAAGHLLDGARAAVAVGVAAEPGRVLAPLAGVAPAADPVHGDRQGLVRLLADRCRSSSRR